MAVALFVYGGLMKGGRFASQFDKERKVVGLAKLTGYRMYDSDREYPVIIYTENEDDFVIGELHLYDKAQRVLKRMGEIEGYNPGDPKSSLFILKRVDEPIDFAGARRWIYFFAYNKGVLGMREIVGGQWLK